MDGNRRAGERDLGCLDGAPQVGLEDHRDSVIAPALTQRPGQLAPRLRQLSGEPARRDPSFVVDADRVGLVDELDQAEATRSAIRSPTAGANLKPWPEQAEPTTMRPWRSSTKLSSAVVV